ncbi:MAG: PAS domain-containing protein [Epsilonproteobacteria bacterium]|nr:PAS domain-containing protein [Campylobacterota bacterium]
MVSHSLIWELLILSFVISILFYLRQKMFVKYNQKLERTQEHFNLGQQIAGIGIWNLDYTTGELEWTNGVHHIFGTDPSTFEVTYEAFLHFVHPEDREMLDCVYNDSVKNKQDYFIKHRVLLDNGSLKYVEERCQNIFDAKGNIIRSIGTVLDITKQQKLEEKILQINRDLELKIEERTAEQNVLLSLFDKGESVLFKWHNDATWSVDLVSQTVKNVLGYDRSDFLNQTINYVDCIHKDDLDLVMQEVIDATSSGKDYFEHAPYRIHTKEGKIKWVHDSTVIVRDIDGNIINFVGYISDITELKEKDRQLLQQSRLAQMGEMISMIAHQWRQPLSAIASTSIDLKLKMAMGDFDLARGEQRQECAIYLKSNLDKIDYYVKNLTTTIDDFRNFYKPNKKAVRVLISAPVKKALNIIRDAFEVSNIRIEEHYNCKQKVEIYENEMMQVILNLLKNAQDNFKEKRIKNPKIKISTMDLDNGKVRLEIFDNGGGIEEEVLQKIFDPYFSTKHEKDGTGLGLYMCKTIVETHHAGKLYAINRDDGIHFNIDIKAAEKKAQKGKILEKDPGILGSVESLNMLT